MSLSSDFLFFLGFGLLCLAVCLASGLIAALKLAGGVLVVMGLLSAAAKNAS